MGLGEELARWLSGCRTLVVMGIGNPLRRDDAVGLELVRALRGRVPEGVVLLECGPVPENLLGQVRRARPSHVLLVDAAELGARPGEARLIGPDRIRGVAISTHKPPLHITAGYIKRTMGAEVALLAIQPADTGFGEGLTPELEEAVAALADAVSEALRTSLSRSAPGAPEA